MASKGQAAAILLNSRSLLSRRVAGLGGGVRVTELGGLARLAGSVKDSVLHTLAASNHKRIYARHEQNLGSQCHFGWPPCSEYRARQECKTVRSSRL